MPKNIKFTFLFFLLFFSFTLLIYSQQSNITFDRLTIEDGLSQSSVFTVMQDKNGFIWFATQDGLNKYDGYEISVYNKKIYIDSTSMSDGWINWICEDEDGHIWLGTSAEGLNRFNPETEIFEHFRYNAQDKHSIANERILVVFNDSKNNIWIGTDGGGISKYIKKTNNFINYEHDANDPSSLSHNSVLSIYEDKKGNLWFGTEGGGLNKFNPKNESFTRYEHLPANPNGLIDNKVYTILENKFGILWIGTGNGLTKFNPNKNTFINYKNIPGKQTSLSNNNVRSLLEDKHGNLWIGTYGGGLNKFDYETETFSHYKYDVTNPKSLSNDIVWNLFQDKSGTIWVGTNGGVSKFTKGKFAHFKNIPSDSESLSDNFLWSIYEDKSGLVWIGTNGGGLECFNRKTNKFTHFVNDPQNENSLLTNRVLSITEDKKRILWIGTREGGLSRFNPRNKHFFHFQYVPGDSNSLVNNNVWCVFADSKGYIWAGTDKGISRYNKRTNKFENFQHKENDVNSLGSDRVRVIFEDSQGIIWVGTYGGGLNRFDPKTNKITRFENDPYDKNSISNNRIRAIHEDSLGVLWIGTGEGLNKFDKVNNKFDRYTKENGLPNNVIYGILEDSEGNLWLSTNGGLSCFDPINSSFKNYDIQDGLQSNEFNAGAYCKSKIGEMYFGGVNGFNIFDPSEIRISDFVPPIHITAFTKFDKKIKFKKSISKLGKIVLSYTDNHFSFEFSSLDFTNSKKNQYAYKLEGFDKNWVFSGDRRYANYTNISGGEYTFKVKGTNSDGVWNETGTSINLEIIPPFYYTWWFRILFGIITASFIYIFYKVRVNSIKKQREQLQAQVKERTAELTNTNKNLRKAKALTQRRAAQATMLNKLSQRISGNLDLTTLLNEIADAVQIEFQYKEVLIYMIDRNGKNIFLKSYAGSDSNNMITQCKIGEGMIGEVAQSGQVKLNNNEEYDSKEQAKSELAIPIKFGAKVFGVLDIQSDQINAFDTTDITTMETFGSQISSAINNARLFEQAQAEIKVRKIAENKSRKMAIQSSMLNDIGQRISSELELNTLLNEIVESARDAFDYYGVMLLLPDKNKKGLLLQSIAGGYKNIFPDDLFIKYGEGMIGTAFSEKKIQVSGDVTKDKNYIMKAEEVTQSELSVPIIDGGRVIGVLDIQSDKLNVFDTTDIATMETFSTQIAAAIKNASLYNQAQQEINERKRTQSELLKSRDSLTLAKKETDNILNNVAEGLFLINNRFKIGSQYSKALEDIFEQKDLGELDILSYIEEKVQSKIFENIKQFMELMFDDSVHEETINELNPLSEIELTFRNNKSMVTETKFLSFKFRRIFKHKKVNELIATVVNITDQIILQKKLIESESKSKKQMEWLFSILHVDPQLLKDFIDSVQKEIESIEYYMKQGDQGQGYHQILENIYRSVHLIKGNASLLDLKFFVNSTHEYEDKIAELKEKDQLSGKDFVPLILKLGDLRKNLNEINSLINRIGKFHSNFRPKRSYENKMLINSIDNLIINLSKDLGTEVRFVHDDFDGESIPYEYRILTKDIFIQMVRNSMSHGIESKEERKNKKKNLYGTIKVSSEIKNKKLILKYYDDGRGIQTDKLKEKVRSNGKWKKIDEFDERQINELIFETGISTSEKANVVSGRGLGMDIIKRKIQEHSGSVNFFSKQGEYCEFNISLPIYNNRETDEDIIQTKEILQV